MSLILDGSAGVTFPSGSGTQAAQSKVLQVVSGTIQTQISTTSTSFVSTGLTASITPLFSTSKIYVVANGVFETTTSGNFYATIYRNSTNVGNATSGMTQLNSQGNWYSNTMTYLDSPATTSSTSYTVYYRQGAGNTAYFGGDSCLCTITLMEIAQ